MCVFCELYNEQSKVLENIHVKSMKKVQITINSHQVKNRTFPVQLMLLLYHILLPQTNLYSKTTLFSVWDSYKQYFMEFV